MFQYFIRSHWQIHVSRAILVTQLSNDIREMAVYIQE